jgi:putative DNA primase/helicase
MAVWKAAQPLAEDHPYLARMHIKPKCTLREIPLSKAKAILGYTPKHKDEPLTSRLIVIPVKINDWLSTLD